MSEDVEVTEDGEIVASNSGDDLRAGPDVDGWWRVCVSSYEYAAVCLSTATLSAWCRRVLREVDPEAVPPVRDTRTAYSPGEGGASPDILARIADATARVSALTQDERREMLIAALADAAPVEHGGMWPEPCDPVPTVDEAAIRAKVEAEVLAWVEVQMRHVRTVPGASFVWRSGGTEALGELVDDIRAGKHRSTP